jgi:uncharacterized membrane protein HdeD (DUF308 family)
MADDPMDQSERGSLVAMEETPPPWGWLFAGGLLNILAGWFMLGHLVIASVASVMYLGITAIVAGVFQVLNAFSARKLGAFLAILLWGLLVVGAGLAMVSTPVQSTVTLTFFIAAYLVVSGTWRLVVSLRGGIEGRAWLIFSSAVSILLGIMLFARWPLSGLAAIGAFVGIDFLFYGIWLMMRSLVLRQMAREDTGATTTT